MKSRSRSSRPKSAPTGCTCRPRPSCPASSSSTSRPTCSSSTPSPWGNPSSLYYKRIGRLTCVQTQVTIRNQVLIKNKVAAFIIPGGQDNIRAVAGTMFPFWAELGFVFPPFPFIAHSRGWDAEDMQNNVRQVMKSDTLKEAAYELLDRAVDFWTIVDRHKAEMDKPMERAGRKASTLPEPEEIEELTV